MISPAAIGFIRRLTIGCALYCCCNVAAAVGTIVFVPPPYNNTEVLLNTDQVLQIKWTVGDHAVSDETVTASTTLGTLTFASAVTDGEGKAQFTIRSSAAGTAAVTVEGHEVSATLTLQFVEALTPPDSEFPFGDKAVRRLDAQGLGYWLFQDRIGFLAADTFDPATIGTTPSPYSVVDIELLGDSVYALTLEPFVAPAGRSKTSVLRRIAGIFEQQVGIEKAGLVVKLQDREQWSVMPGEVFVMLNGDPDGFALENGLVDFNEFGGIPSLYLGRLSAANDTDPLTLSAILSTSDKVKFAEPNFVIVVDERYTPIAPGDDPGIGLQWHHENDGMFGTEDADIDSLAAWEFTVGSADTVIAVVDSGFDENHYDLDENVWTGINNERGVDLVDNEHSDLLFRTANPEAMSHGTRAAGLAAARGGNTIGYSGTCPHCKLLLIRVSYDFSVRLLGITTATQHGAGIISNSWGHFTNSMAFDAVVNTAVESGAVVLMAMSNVEEDNCGFIKDTSARPNVIGISGITDYDKRSDFPGEALGYGTCMDVLAPTRGGAMGIRTTSVAEAQTAAGHIPTYWDNFSGTSASTPIVAGIVGLLRTLDSSLAPVTIQRVLQDTTDRVDDESGYYWRESGFSNPADIPTHGYGRVNAYEAVKLVAPTTPSEDGIPAGRGQKDLLLRDHDLDWGNTEKPSNVIFNSPRGEYTAHRSADIKLDVYPFQPVPATLDGFLQLQSEMPEVGKRSRVYVRVRNRGPVTVDSADLKIHYAVATGGFPDLPTDFWSSFPSNSADISVWHPSASVLLSDIEYSGPSIAGCPSRPVPECIPDATGSTEDHAQVTVFDVPALDWDEAANQRLVFLAVVNSDEDPVQATLSPPPPGDFAHVLTAVAKDNNVTLIQFSDPGGGELGVCQPETITIIVVLVLTLTCLLLYWAGLRANNQSVPIALPIVILIITIVIIVIVVQNPWCTERATDLVVATQV